MAEKKKPSLGTKFGRGIRDVGEVGKLAATELSDLALGQYRTATQGVPDLLGRLLFAGGRDVGTFLGQTGRAVRGQPELPSARPSLEQLGVFSDPFGSLLPSRPYPSPSAKQPTVPSRPRVPREEVERAPERVPERTPKAGGKWSNDMIAGDPEGYMGFVDIAIAKGGLNEDEALQVRGAAAGRVMGLGDPGLIETVRPWLQEKAFPSFQQRRRIETGTALSEASFGRSLLKRALTEGKKLPSKFVEDGLPTKKGLERFGKFLIVTPQGVFGAAKEKGAVKRAFTREEEAPVFSTIPSSIGAQEAASDIESSISAIIGR